MIYFTSDTHFYHNNIVQLCDRPFRDYDEMHRTLVLNWNSMVRDTDEIYILGDFIHKGNGEEANKILKKLKGKKYLIRGNHDKYLEDIHFDQNLFIWVKDYYGLNYKKIKFILFHYPILEWAGFFRDSIHLYGHVHNAKKDPIQAERLKVLGNRAFNVGVDVNYFAPVSIESILKKIQASNE